MLTSVGSLHAQRIELVGSFAPRSRPLCQVYAQNVSEIDSILSNIPYYNIVLYDGYETNIPDSIKVKVVNILNGYLPQTIIAERSGISDIVLKNISKKAMKKCNKNNMCVKSAIDSMSKALVKESIYNSRIGNRFTQSFILAIGDWQVREADSILWANRESTQYPQPETYYALAKLGNTAALDTIRNMLYADMKKKTPNTITLRLTKLYEVGMYLRDTALLKHTVDYLDVDGIWYPWHDDPDGISLSESIMSKLINFFHKTPKYQEWRQILLRYRPFWYFYPDDYDPNYLLSPAEKQELKIELKRWIEENVHFE